MRKVVYGFGIVMASMVLLTGCGGEQGKVLTCSKTESEEGIFETKTEQKYVFKELEDSKTELSKFTFKAEMKFGEKALEEATKEEIDENLDELLKAFQKETTDGTKINAKKIENGVSVVVEGDLSNISEENKESFLKDDVELTYDAYKKALEEDGFTCK